MERSLRIIDEALTATETTVRVPCKADGDVA
jgi:hypothetical protein